MLLYLLQNATNILLVLVHVDDVIIIGNNDNFLQNIIHQLSSTFALKDLGKLRYFLVLRFIHSKKVSSFHKWSTSMICSPKLICSTALWLPLQCYSRMFNCQMTWMPSNIWVYLEVYKYLTFTRPDIAYVVNHVFQHFQCPTKSNLRALKWILCHLKGTLNFGHRYLAQSPTNIYGFSNLNWVGYLTMQRSTIGYCFFLGENCILQSSKKQMVVAHSSVEVEYRSLASIVVELV